MSTTSIGRQAEAVVATYLQQQNYRIIDQNWRSRWCEIDIIARRQNLFYFVEVKYRQNSNFGVGIDYITPRKLQQMQFAAEFWLAANYTEAAESRLAAAEVSGAEFTITAWLPDL